MKPRLLDTTRCVSFLVVIVHFDVHRLFALLLSLMQSGTYVLDMAPRVGALKRPVSIPKRSELQGLEVGEGVLLTRTRSVVDPQSVCTIPCTSGAAAQGGPGGAT